MQLIDSKENPDVFLNSVLAFAVRDKAEEIVFEPHAEDEKETVIFHKIDGVNHINHELPDYTIDLICDSLKKLATTYDPETHVGRVAVRLSDSTGSLNFNYDFDFTLHPTPTRPQGNPHIVFEPYFFSFYWE